MSRKSRKSNTPQETPESPALVETVEPSTTTPSAQEVVEQLRKDYELEPVELTEPEVVPLPSIEEQFATDMMGAVLCQNCNEPVPFVIPSPFLLKLAEGRGHSATCRDNACLKCGEVATIQVTVQPRIQALARVWFWQMLTGK